MDEIVEYIGLASSILITVMFVPQVVHVYRTNGTHAINYAFLFINLVASTLGLVYSIYFTVVPMIVANTSAGLFSLSLICMKYLNNKPSLITNEQDSC